MLDLLNRAVARLAETEFAQDYAALATAPGGWIFVLLPMVVFVCSFWLLADRWWPGQIVHVRRPGEPQRSSVVHFPPVDPQRAKELHALVTGTSRPLRAGFQQGHDYTKGQAS